jgi:L-aspartate oxidase
MDRIIVIGGGVAGLATALRLAPLQVILLAGAKLASGAATAWAQGGIAAALADGDSPASHAADTLKAGAGIGDPAIARMVAAAAPDAIEWLARLGAPFDRDGAGRLALGLEGAHSHRRIVHARGDATGAAVLETLIRAAREQPSIELHEEARAVELVRDRNGGIAGVMASRGGASQFIPARAVVLATGGIGGLYAHTTNPLGAVGSGLAIAARAGAILRDLEFVQFHPTAIDLGCDPMPLATEALRGEGAILINGRGERFMAAVPGAELAPRDIVARAIWRELGQGERVYLDGRAALGADFPRRFPSVTAACRRLGIDPATMPIPVRPAAHYHMGGIASDARGRSSLAGLWACGEVAATGLHGANRLASNSLLEALVFAQAIAEDVGALAPRRAAPVAVPQAPASSPTANLAETRHLMEEKLGVIRDAEGIADAVKRFDGMTDDGFAQVGLMIAASAWRRRESRGGHFRADHPAPRAEFARSSEITLAQARGLAAELGAASRARGGKR